MSLNESLKQILPTLEQNAQQDPKTLVLDTAVATQVRDELTNIMNARLLLLEPGVTYPWSPAKQGTTGGTAAPATAATPKHH